MNRILCFSLLVCLATSCQKSILQEAQNVEEVQLANYYLDLDISNIDYMSAEDQDVTHVDADQDLDFTEVSYLAEEDAIVVGGTFEVELKVMSCGFYSFYSVQEASFRALIQ